MSSVIEVARSAIRVLEAVGHKQLMGEPGAADEATDAYRGILEGILLLWIADYASLNVEDQEALDIALEDLVGRLESAALQELPNAFEMGFGRRPDPAQILELQAALLANTQFLSSSLVPYIQQDLTEGLLGQIADARSFAWASRVGLYAGTYWTAIWLGVQENLRDSLDTETVPVRRLLDPQAEHCGTCPGKAREYGSWNEMMAFAGGLPADGSDDCHSNCRCQLEIFIEGEWVGI